MKREETNKNMAALASRTSARLLRLGELLMRVLSFSLADERLAPGRCLAVHLDYGGTEVACGERLLSRIKIRGTRRYPSAEGNYPAPKELAAAVHLARNDFAAEQAEITLIIPKAWTIIKTAEFPLIVKKNLSDVVSYELDRLTPLSADQAYYDYQLVKEERDRLQIIMAVVKAETLDPYLHALMQRGIQVQRVIVNLSALGALASSVHGGKTTLFMDIRPGWYESGLFAGGLLTAASAGSFPSDDEVDRVRIIAEAMNPQIDSLKKEGKSPALFVDSRIGGPLPLAERLQAPCRFFSQTDLKLRFFKREEHTPYTALGGVLEFLRNDLHGMNLLAKGIHKRARPPVALTIFILLALASLVVFSEVSSLQDREERVAAVEREIAARSAEIKRIEAMKKKATELEAEIKTIEQFKATKPMVLDLLRELTRILPNTTWLARVRVADTTVNIEGFAAAATDILPKLESSRYFRKVEFASPTYRDIRMNADRFAIKMEIEGAPAEKGAK